jgi:hypothetical protein
MPINCNRVGLRETTRDASTASWQIAETFQLIHPMARIGNRRHIPEAVKETIITMSRTMTSRDIATATNIGRRTVNRLLHLYKETGSVVKTPEVMGRPRLLNSLDAAVGSNSTL